MRTTMMPAMTLMTPYITVLKESGIQLYVVPQGVTVMTLVAQVSNDLSISKLNLSYC